MYNVKMISDFPKCMYTTYFLLAFMYNNQLSNGAQIIENWALSGNQGSIPCQIIPKTQKMVLETYLLNTQYYKVWIKLSNPEKGVVFSPKLWCSSY